MAVTKGSLVTNYGIELDGVFDAFVTEFTIPTLEAEEITAGLSSDWQTKKMRGGPKYGSFDFSFNLSRASGALDWARSVWKKSVIEKDLAVVLANSNFEITRRVDLIRSLISAIEFPEFDAKDGKKQLTAKIKGTPEQITFSKGGGKLQGITGGKAKTFTTQNFRVDIPGLASEWFTSFKVPDIEIKLAEEYYGTQRLPSRLYSAVNVKDATAKIAQPGQDALTDLAMKMLQDGYVSESEYVTGTLTVLSQNMKDELATFTMSAMGLKKMELPKLEGNKETNNYCTATWHCEELEYELLVK
jgi:hypothetical protein